VVHALRQIHRSLRPDGLLLDVHPQPVNPRVEVRQGGLVHDLGEIDAHEDNREVEDARIQLEVLVREGLFSQEATDFFDWCEHHDSVAGWQERLASEEWGLVAPPEMIETAQRLLSSGGGELVIKLQVRATRLRRLAG